VLGRLRVRSGKLARIGKEVDRLEADDGATLEGEDPVAYGDEEARLCRNLRILSSRPRKEVALALGVSERRLGDVLKGRAKPRKQLREAILHLAEHL
jgi:hypothetical protein